MAKLVTMLARSRTRLVKVRARSLTISTRCPKKKWDLLLVIVAVNPSFFGTPCIKFKGIESK